VRRLVNNVNARRRIMSDNGLIIDWECYIKGKASTTKRRIAAGDAQQAVEIFAEVYDEHADNRETDDYLHIKVRAADCSKPQKFTTYKASPRIVYVAYRVD
jgi:hypothetical protein